MATTTKKVEDFEATFVPPKPLAVGDLLFRRMNAHEALGRLPEYHIELLRPSTKAAVEAKSLLGKTAAIKLRLDASTYRHFHGVVTRFRRGGATGRFDIYHVEIRPWLWHLTLGADCRIFQDKAADEIIKLVFEDYKSDVNFQDMCDGSFRKRPFTVQYRETDFDFVSRLMEEEGIYYWFRHEAGKHTLVMCNGPRGHKPIAGENLHWPASLNDNQLREDIVTQWDLSHQLRPLKYAHTDYAAEAPTADLKKEAKRDPGYTPPGDLEVFDYPGGYDDIAMAEGKVAAKQQEAERLAQLRVDTFESGHTIATGVTPSRDVAAGLTFKYLGHDDRDDYLVTSADYQMEFAGYEANLGDGHLEFGCRFEAVPKRAKFQPQPTTTRPLIAGPQTATVVGPAGDEIHTDKYGRVKVKFRWDRVSKADDKASCWVRVAFPWASKQFGMVSLPRIGDEVVVDFLEGNPDRPLVTGAVYNADNMPPYALPAQATVSGIKSQSSKGGSGATFNELRFEDKKGKEYVWLNAEKDFHRWVRHDAFDTVKNDVFVDVTRNVAQKIGDKYAMQIGNTAKIDVASDVDVNLGADLTLNIGSATALTIGAATAMTVSQAMALTVGAGFDLLSGAAMKITAGASLHLKAGAGLVIDGGPTLTIKAGAGSVVLGPDGVSITGTMVKINSGGSPSPALKADKASPPKPKKPAALKADKDPLA